MKLPRDIPRPSMRWLGQLGKPFWINVSFFVFCTSLTILIFALGIIPQVCIPQDLFALLETAERIHRGLRPYVDFDTLIGPLSFAPLLIGISFVGVVPYAFVIANAITVPMIAALTWYYFLSRRPTVINLFLSSYICLTMCDPVPLHGRLDSFSYGMFYDRAGFSILSLLLILVLEQESNISLIFGFLIGVLFFIKVPFGVSGGILSCLYLLRNGNTKSIIRIITGFLFVFLPLTWYLGLDGLYGMIAYVVNCARIQPALYAWDRSWQVIFDSALLLPILPLIIYMVRSKLCDLYTALTNLAFTTFSASLANYCCTPTNAFPDLPIYVVFYFFLMGQSLRGFTSKYWLAGYLTLASGFMGLNYLRDVSAYCLLIFATFIYHFPNRPSISGYVKAPGFEHLELYTNTSHESKDNLFYYEINDGLDLIAHHPQLVNAKIACIDFADWFSLPRHAPSPEHMPIVIQFGYTLNADHIPPPEIALKGCAAIMVFKNTNDYKSGARLLMNNYVPYFEKHFDKYEESDCWILLYN